MFCSLAGLRGIVPRADPHRSQITQERPPSGETVMSLRRFLLLALPFFSVVITDAAEPAEEGEPVATPRVNLFGPVPRISCILGGRALDICDARDA